MPNSCCLRVGLTLALVFLAGPALADEQARGPSGRVLPVATHPLALQKAADCDEVRGYMTDVIVETLVRNLYWWWPLPWSGGEGDSGGGAPSDYTGTNNQEQGVDELDLVKTDGEHLYLAQDYALRIVDSWPPEESHLLATLDLDGYASGLFLDGTWVLTFSSFWQEKDVLPHYWSGTRIQLVDVSDPAAPLVARTVDVEGTLVGARMVDGHVFAALWSYLEMPQAAWELIWNEDLDLPRVDWDATEEEREEAARTAREILRPHVAAIVAGLRLEELLPLVSDRTPDSPEGEPRLLLDCENVYLPPNNASSALLSVLHIDLNGTPAANPLDATGILADGFTLYASANNLYIAESRWWWWWWEGGGNDHSTTIHKFELDTAAENPVRYAATGEVPGWLLNQFSMSEDQGYLRVATTDFNWWRGGPDGEDTGSNVSVLADDGIGTLALAGQLRGIAPGEQIYASRFLGDQGYLVTFRQVDPLFTLDLSDPTDPRLVGQLEVTGYSAYLHPVDADHLLAVGMEADQEGRVIGLAVSVFDVSDFAHPALDHRYLIESSQNQWSWSEALSDHHAFTFHRGVLSIPAYISDWSDFFSGLVVLAVDVDAGIQELGRVDHSDLPGPPGWMDNWVWMRRSVYVEDSLYSISDRGVKVNELMDPATLQATVPFYSN